LQVECSSAQRFADLVSACAAGTEKAKPELKILSETRANAATKNQANYNVHRVIANKRLKKNYIATNYA